MKTHKYRYFCGDFETTVYEGQQFTEVWASASVELFTEEVTIFHSIKDQFEYFREIAKKEKTNIICYYHNLKFDGNFWMSFLLNDLNYKQAFEKIEIKENVMQYIPIKRKDMKNNTFNYVISNLGQWYTITIKSGGHFIEFRDSLKLLPFSVERIGKSFGTKHKKLNMEYKGFRYSGCEITEEEEQYIKNDVLVVKEALEIMFKEGHKRMTIGSCCLAEYKKIIGRKAYSDYFPDMYNVDIDHRKYGVDNVGDYIRNSYRGGWCYLVKGKEKKVFNNGVTFDVNSLYPSMMSSESLNKYPTGKPKFWKGNFIPDEALSQHNFFFIRIKTRFYLKEGKLPFIQLKSNPIYKMNEMLETSDVKNPETGNYCTHYIDLDGNVKDTRQIMTLTMMDFRLLMEHYNLVDFEILDGCYFRAAIGIFDGYISKYKKIKLESKGAKRELSKLFLNNLYGKMAASKNSSFKVAYLKEGGIVGFITQTAEDKTPGYIPVGSAITSYARCFTIRAAQKNFNGADNPGFIYADTDSIHCDLKQEEVKGIKVHDKNFCCWKLEKQWDVGFFNRQKTYIEGVKEGDHIDYEVKCAGMPDRSKQLFLAAINHTMIKPENSVEREFLDYALEKDLKLQDFDIRLRVPGKLLPKRIKGGVVLVDTTYEMR